jgi:hypothetical protein
MNFYGEFGLIYLIMSQSIEGRSRSIFGWLCFSGGLSCCGRKDGIIAKFAWWIKVVGHWVVLRQAGA